MTDILLINPNTTASITDLVLRTAKRFAAEGTKLRAVTGAFGPRYIASRVGYAIAGHAAVDAFASDRGRKDAVVLACFGDPGLAALKEIARVPVVGMADASILQACALGNRFSIVTGGERWKSMLEEFVASHGLSSRLASIRTVAPTGADIARNPKAAMALLAKGCTTCVREDGADVVILRGGRYDSRSDAGQETAMSMGESVKKIEGLLASLKWPVIGLGPGTWRSSFRGRTTVFPLVIQVQPQGDRAWCKLAVLPVVRLPADPDKAEKLYERLLHLNGEMLMSRFSLDEDGDVLLSVEFPIVDLDPSELRDALDVLSVYAERYHAELRQMVA